MGLFTKDIQTMDDLLLHGLKDIYYAENQIVKALPKMIDKATNRDLIKGLKDHLAETEKQVERLGQVFKLLGQEPQRVQCPAIDGLISEADEVAGEETRPHLVPVWRSRFLTAPASPVIANGIVFALSTGTHATLYALDAVTGKELYSSGNAVKPFTRSSGLAVANGHVCFGTSDSTLYCFGIPFEI